MGLVELLFLLSLPFLMVWLLADRKDSRLWRNHINHRLRTMTRLLAAAVAGLVVFLASEIIYTAAKGWSRDMRSLPEFPVLLSCTIFSVLLVVGLVSCYAACRLIRFVLTSSETKPSRPL